jgi:hypothetical protein
MADELYVARGKHRLGPVSAARLRAFAATGKLLPTDTIWKEGMEQPVPANRVQNLFAIPSAPVPTPIAPVPELPPALIVAPPPPPPEQARKRRAVALSGAIILSQDGYHVQYRKKCTTCGHEEASRSTMLISNGSTRAHFFCPKCRKPRQVEIKGTVQ